MTEKDKKNITMVRNVLGAFLIFLHNEPFYYWGNLSIYVTSYGLNQAGTSSDDIHPSWVFAVESPCWITALWISGYLATFVNTRLLLGFAIFLQNASFFVIYFLVDVSLPATYITFGLFVGLGCGFYEGILLQEFVLNLSERHSSFLTSVVLAGGAVGGIVINQFVTWYTNPRDLFQDSTVGGIMVFTQEEITSNVPPMLLILGGVISIFQLLGLILLQNVTAPSEETNVNGHVVNNNYNSIEQTTTPSYSTTTSSSSPPPPPPPQPPPSPSSQQDIARMNHRDTEPSAKSIGEIDIIKIQEKKKHYTPRQLLKCFDFYKLSAVYILGIGSRMVVTTYYKTYGQTHIELDHFLTDLGTAQAILEVLCMIVWGYVIDRMGETSSLVAMYSFMALTLLLMYFTAMWNKWAYFVATLFASAMTNIYTAISLTAVKWFGSKYFSMNLAMVEGMAAIAIIIPSLVLDSLIVRFGYFFAFAWAAISCVGGLIVIVVSFPNN